jgi:predicted phage tail protein
MKNGIPYITNGLGGESTGDFFTPIEGSAVRFGDDYGAMRVTASSTLITFEFITHRGVVIDNYSMGQQTSTPAAPSNLTASAASGSQINLTWTDNASNENGFFVEYCPGAGCTNFAQVAQAATNATSYAHLGLSSGSTYRYRVRSFNGNGNSIYSNVAEASTNGVPTAPTNLSATAVSASQINLTWVDNSNNESGFYIERCANASCTNFSQVAQTSANATTYANSGLSAGSTYSYRIRAFNATGTSAYSNVAQATTTTATTFGAPSNLLATAVSSEQIDVRWTDNSTSEDGFKLYRSTDGVEFFRTAILGSNVTSYSNTGRPEGTTYYYKVLAYNVSGSTAFSNTAQATTFIDTVKPNAPTNLLATAVSSSQINMSWTDNSNNEVGFKVYRSSDGVNFVEVFRAGPNITNYAAAGLTSNTSYHFRVRAYNDMGGSAYTTIVKVTTR